MNEEIALFIDFENIRYSLLNVRHREPDPQELIGVARRFGTVMVARAYADWTRQPDFFKGSLTAAMIDRVDCPAKLRDRYRSNASGAQYGGGYGSYVPGSMQRSYEQEQSEASEDEMLEEPPTDEMDESAQDAGDQLDEEVVSGQAEDEALADDAFDGENEAEEQSQHYEPEHYEPERYEPERYESGNHRPYAPANAYHGGPQYVTTQSSVDLNMLMDIIETVFDRPSINTYVLMTGDRDFTRICARLKLRLNKRVIIVGVPGTVSRDLISAASQFIPLGGPMPYARPGMRPDYVMQGPVEPEEPGFIQFLDYIDSHWAWRTVGGIANFIGDPYNPKNRFRGRLTRDSARDLLRDCIDHGILIASSDPVNGESLRLNRSHPAVEAVLNEPAPQ